MSGHSKWATIHRKKGELDAQRGKLFQKIAKEIYVAAKGTNGDPDSNPALRAVIEKARGNNMPKDNIQKAIDKSVGGQGGEDYEQIRYEGYASGGVALMIDCLTDNRNRTAMLVRSTLTKRGGNLGTDGSVSYLFARKGVIVIDKTITEYLKTNEIHQIEKWCNLKCSNIVFDSEIHNWKENESEFDTKIFGKEKLTFLIEDNENNLFGAFVSKKIDDSSFCFRIIIS